jgi:tetratricopeptide (TPR) repeat protein
VAPRERRSLPAVLSGAPLLAALLLVGPAACRSSGPSIPLAPIAEPGPYDRLAPGAAERLAAAVRDLEAGLAGAAYEPLETLARSHPRNVVVGRWLQEAESALVDPQAPVAGEQEGADVLRRAWRGRADADPSPTALILAARLEDDPTAALLLLERALELDGDCAWAHYAQAAVHARAGDWGAARSSARAALEREPGHLATLRLWAWLEGHTARRAGAIVVLGSWLERAALDPGTSPGQLFEGRLDLALLLLEEDRAQEAREVLDVLSAEGESEARRLAALAVAEVMLGDPLAARAAADQAQEADRSALLPAAQEALLEEFWLRNVERARESWRRVLVLSGSRADLGSLMQRLRAQVHLGRLPRAVEEGE